MSEGEVPIHLLKSECGGNLANIEIIAKRIKEMFKEGKYFPDLDHVQLAYESYC